MIVQFVIIYGLSISSFDFDPTTKHTFFSLIIGGFFFWLPKFGINQSSVQRFGINQFKDEVCNDFFIKLKSMEFINNGWQ